MAAATSTSADEPTTEPVFEPITEPGAGQAHGWGWLVAALSGAAGLIHLVMVPLHAGDGMTDPVLFAAAAFAQLAIAAAVISGRATKLTWWTSAAINVGLLGMWAWSRSRGLPWGGHANQVQSVQFVDTLSAGFAGLAALGSVVMATASNRLGRARLTPLVGAAAAIAIAGMVIVSPDTATHNHDGGSAHDHDTAAHLADMATIDETRCDLAFNPISYWNEAHQLGVDTYTGAQMTGHGHPSAESDSLLAIAARPDPFDGRGSAVLDELIATTDQAGQGEGAAARLVNRLSEAGQTEYDAWLGWLRTKHSTGDAHAGGAGDDTGGHGGHVGPQPWKAMMDPDQCDRLRSELGQARAVSERYPTVADAEAGGWTKVTSYVSGIAAHYMKFSIVDGTFDIEQPEMLLYDGVLPNSRMVGISYYLLHDGTSEPTQGFTGGNDHFHRHIGLCQRGELVIGDSTLTAEQCQAIGGVKSGGDAGWMSHAWVVPGCESPWGVFSAASPMLDRTLTQASGTNDGGCEASGVRDRYDLDAGDRATVPTSAAVAEQAAGN